MEVTYLVGDQGEITGDIGRSRGEPVYSSAGERRYARFACLAGPGSSMCTPLHVFPDLVTSVTNF